jgi:hypothetical protein
MRPRVVSEKRRKLPGGSARTVGPKSSTNLRIVRKRVGGSSISFLYALLLPSDHFSTASSTRASSAVRAQPNAHSISPLPSHRASPLSTNPRPPSSHPPNRFTPMSSGQNAPALPRIGQYGSKSLPKLIPSPNPSVNSPSPESTGSKTDVSTTSASSKASTSATSTSSALQSVPVQAMAKPPPAAAAAPASTKPVRRPVGGIMKGKETLKKERRKEERAKERNAKAMAKAVAVDPKKRASAANDEEDSSSSSDDRPLASKTATATKFAGQATVQPPKSTPTPTPSPPDTERVRGPHANAKSAGGTRIFRPASKAKSTAPSPLAASSPASAPTPAETNEGVDSVSEKAPSEKANKRKAEEAAEDKKKAKKKKRDMAWYSSSSEDEDGPSNRGLSPVKKMATASPSVAPKHGRLTELVEEGDSKASRAPTPNDNGSQRGVGSVSEYQRQERHYVEDLAAFERLRDFLVQARARVAKGSVPDQEAIQLLNDFKRCESLHSDLTARRARLVEWQRGLGIKV